MKRTREEVDATLQIAKLNAAELLPAVHCLGFGPRASGAGGGDFCLLELEPALCQQLEAGHRCAGAQVGCASSLVPAIF